MTDSTLQNAKTKLEKNSTQEYFLEADFVVASGDYNYIEQNLLEMKFRKYSKKYWQSRTFSPSSLLVYLGFDCKIEGFEHHNLFFDTDFDLHADEIYKTGKWPTEPLFYACCPSKTDPNVAPKDCENIFLLMPIAPGIKDTENLRQEYLDKMIQRMEKNLNLELKSHVILKRTFCVKDFENDYFSYKGNAYGLANTLFQTAIFKPSLKSKMENLYFAGQLTVPGPGLPPSLVSGKIVANEIIKKNNQTK